MRERNKKISKTQAQSSQKNELDAFLAYCAYDVRWYRAGNQEKKKTNFILKIVFNSKGEAAPTFQMPRCTEARKA
jgi:hypothetical protein